MPLPDIDENGIVNILGVRLLRNRMIGGTNRDVAGVHWMPARRTEDGALPDRSMVRIHRRRRGHLGNCSGTFDHLRSVHYGVVNAAEYLNLAVFATAK